MGDVTEPAAEPDGEQGPAPAWTAFVDGLRKAGDRLARDVRGLDAAEQADGYRALIRGLNNQLARFEVDRERPELVAFNGWREKFFMDNPDFRYWVADIRDDRRYRITGELGDAVYLSITAYAGSGAVGAAATSRLDLDGIAVDDEGRFEVIVARDRPEAGDWLALPEGATALWVREFHDDAATDRLGSCRIEPLEGPAVPPGIDPERFDKHLARLGTTMAFLPTAFAGAVAAERERPNEIRHWSEMAGGAVYTEPGIHYLRGSWELAEGEALVIEGPVAPCRYWNVLLYSRFLNSLDHRYRRVSRTGGTASVVEGRYRFVVAAHDPGGTGDWLDTEGRPFGLVVFRWLQPETEPELPTVRVVRLDDLADEPAGVEQGENG